VPEKFLICVCASDEARDLALQDTARASILSRAEESVYQRLRSDKRRRDWLAGRVAAKRALCLFFQQTKGFEPAFPILEIGTDSRGAPLCAAPGSPHFSISHCAAGGLCAAAWDGRRVGADWEPVAPRSSELKNLFCRPGELSSEQDHPSGQTRLWAIKEAALKLLGVGLACPPRDVEVGAAGIIFHGDARRHWAELGSPKISHAAATIENCAVAVVTTGD
jgi:4'-phosphopantetheinyl transferase